MGNRSTMNSQWYQEKARRFIEKDLPVRKISEAARKEKLGRAKPRISEMHYWWTRKPLVSSRTAILGSMMSDDVPAIIFTKMRRKIASYSINGVLIKYE